MAVEEMVTSWGRTTPCLGVVTGEAAEELLLTLGRTCLVHVSIRWHRIRGTLMTYWTLGEGSLRAVEGTGGAGSGSRENPIMTT